ncbi:hypothetical protein CKA32_004121 [Geitlerinema sp. FC II]|nr:hypothetical protein CKA32_004121 [Geitlerinema sp. FC II]
MLQQDLTSKRVDRRTRSREDRLDWGRSPKFDGRVFRDTVHRRIDI